jgi:methyl-accepting chemotaxis protein
MRAAEAAKNTSELIEGSNKRIKDASTLTEQVIEAIGENAKIAQKVTQLTEEMNAQASQMLTYVHELLAIIGGHEAGGMRQNAVLPERKAAPLPRRTSRAGAKRVTRLAVAKQGQVVRPEEILPLEEAEFNDF